MATICPNCNTSFVLKRTRLNTLVSRFENLTGYIFLEILYRSDTFRDLTPAQIQNACWQMVKRGAWEHTGIGTFKTIRKIKMEQSKENK